MLVFTSVLVLAIFFTVYVITDIKSYKQRKTESVISLARVVSTNSIPTLLFQDEEAARLILAGLNNGAPDIVYASIIDSSGNLFASYSKPGTSDINITASVLKGRQFTFTNDFLFVENDIFNETHEIGKVFLAVELSGLKQIIQSKYKIGALLLIIAVAFSYLIALFIQSYISRRLLRLANTMKEVSKTGDYRQSISDDGKDEISTLIHVFNNLMQRVIENERKKDEFISIASHELKTPLTSIKGYLELLNEIEDKEPNKKFVCKGLDNVSKLEKLIRDLLDVSKIQSGQLELELKEFNIDSLLDETIASIQMVTGTHMIIREGSFSNEIVLADRQRIEQVLTNLLSNAIKYSPGEKKVIVQSRKAEKEIIVKVRDFGMGVPENEQSNIFERFYRTKDMSITITGFGLGLYICRDIITRHRGKIWMENKEKGAAFYFSLPINSDMNTGVEA